MRRTGDEPGELHDLVEIVQGIAQLLMGIDAKLNDIIVLLGGDEDEEADA